MSSVCPQACSLADQMPFLSTFSSLPTSQCRLEGHSPQSSSLLPTKTWQHNQEAAPDSSEAHPSLSSSHCSGCPDSWCRPGPLPSTGEAASPETRQLTGSSSQCRAVQACHSKTRWVQVQRFICREELAKPIPNS